MLPPPLHGFFKASNNGKTDGSDTRRNPVDPTPCIASCRLKRFADRLVMRLAVVHPIAHDKLTDSVQNRAKGTKAKRRQYRKPGQHAKHMSMRRDHRMLNHMADDLTLREFACVDVLPRGQ